MNVHVWNVKQILFQFALKTDSKEIRIPLNTTIYKTSRTMKRLLLKKDDSVVHNC